MIYLSGAVRQDMVWLHPNLGFMHTPMMGNGRIAGTIAGADTGLFGKPKTWTLQYYIDWLDRERRVYPGFLFATAPDVVGDAEATLERSMPVLPEIRKLGIPAAFVAQDGLFSHPIPWEDFDCLFIGGTDEFKLGPDGERAIYEAKTKGKWVHVGRVNSYKRLAWAESLGSDSADGTCVAIAPDHNAPLVVGWLARLDAIKQMHMNKVKYKQALLGI